MAKTEQKVTQGKQQMVDDMVSAQVAPSLSPVKGHSSAAQDASAARAAPPPDVQRIQHQQC